MERPQSRQLASVKHQIYHPRLPSMRQMDMDTVSHKLSSEHSRHTTYCSPDEFIKSRSTLHVRQPPVHCRNIVNSETEKKFSNYKPLNRSYIDDWNKILGNIRSFEQKDKKNRDSCGNEFTGLFIRRKHPEITASWKHALEVKSHTRPRVSSAKPMPATMYSRYRNTSRPYSAYPWY